MDWEKEIISYLEEYGNTREEDLVDYLAHGFNCSPGKAKKILHHMIVKGQIYRLIHERLDPPRVYVTLELQIRSEGLKDAVGTMTPAACRSEAQRILEEAAMIAEKRKQDRPFTPGNT